MTVVLSTHLLAEVEELCTRVLILNRGRVVADGTVADVAGRAAAPRARASGRAAGSPTARSRRDPAFAVGAVAGAGSIGSPGTAPPRRGGSRPADCSARTSVAFEFEAARLSDAFLTMTEPS